MKKKILIVDNNKVILKLMTNMLQTMGHEVKTADNGLAALEVLKSYHPDVMFVDLIMPNIAGDILCRIIRKKPEFDSIFITIISAVAVEEKIDFFSFGADACIAKGAPEGIKKHITSILAQAEKRETLPFNKGILGAKDVHEREVTKELLTRKKHFEITLDNMDDGFLELTLSGKIVFANSMATALFNSSEEKLLSTNFLDNFDETQRDYLAIYSDQTHQNPIGLGEDHPIQVNGKYVLLKFIPIVEQEQKSIIVLIKDITQRKHAEQKLQDHMSHLEQRVVERTAELHDANKLLQEKEHFQEKLLNDMLTFVAVLEPNGEVIFVNNTPLKIGGLKLEEVIGKKFFDAPWWTYSDEVRNLVIHDIKRCCSGDSLVHDIPIKIADGSLMWIEFSMHPIFDKDGAVQYLIPEGRDISDRKQAEEERVKLEAQLQQAMRMEAIGTLAGGIAHDFNNILSAILGYSEMARAELPDDALIASDLDQVIIAGKRATELVKQILTFSRQGEEDLKPLKIQLIVKEALKLLRSSLPTTIQLKQDIANNTGLILADPTQIHQVLMNLCTNAKHAIDPEGGTLSVSLSEVQVTGADTIADCPQLEHGSYLDLVISDTGCGMSGLICSRIFDPFFTTKEKGKGTGLGLAVVHGIIKQHKGEITVASKLGQGTTFHVYLPVIDEEIQAEEIMTEDIPRGSERILLVDDEIALVELMQRILNKLGYTVTAFTSSLEALAAYKKNPGDFDLVITDMTMPDMTGTTLAKKIFALRSDLPVILCTGFSETIDAKKAKSLGIREYIMKPVVRRTLAKAIRKALMRIS